MSRIQHWQLTNTSTTSQSLTKYATKNHGKQGKRKELKNKLMLRHLGKQGRTGNWFVIIMVLHGSPVNPSMPMFMFIKMLIKWVRLSVLLAILSSELTWHFFFREI
jgi:hypothetical protein